jgi:alkylation response protein AidB-like acyl-CoA dehydrogenase
VEYAAQREAFGQPIGKNQAIQFMIADMEVRASTARLAYYRAAEKMLRYRDAKILEIGEGTSEVQRMLIARDLGVG